MSSVTSSKPQTRSASRRPDPELLRMAVLRRRSLGGEPVEERLVERPAVPGPVVAHQLVGLLVGEGEARHPVGAHLGLGHLADAGIARPVGDAERRRRRASRAASRTAPGTPTRRSPRAPSRCRGRRPGCSRLDPPLPQELGPLEGVADHPVRAVVVEPDVGTPVERRAAVVVRSSARSSRPSAGGPGVIGSASPWLNSAIASPSMWATLAAGRAARWAALAAVPLVLKDQVPCRKCPSSALIRGSPAAVTVATLSTFMPVSSGDQVGGAAASGRRG